MCYFFYPRVPAAHSLSPAVHILVMWPHTAHASLPKLSPIGQMHRMYGTYAACTMNLCFSNVDFHFNLFAAEPDIFNCTNLLKAACDNQQLAMMMQDAEYVAVIQFFLSTAVCLHYWVICLGVIVLEEIILNSPIKLNLGWFVVICMSLLQIRKRTGIPNLCGKSTSLPHDKNVLTV